MILPGTHGTHVTDIAAGNGNGSGQAGVAPKADIIFVEAAASDIAWQGPETLNQAFGDPCSCSRRRFIFDEAGDRPCVCNLSLGTNGGPHDGSSSSNRAWTYWCGQKDNRAVATAASNSQLDNIHTSGTVPKSDPHDTSSDSCRRAAVSLPRCGTSGSVGSRSLSSRRMTRPWAGATRDNLPLGANGQIAIFISSRLDDPNNHDNVIGVWLAQGLSGEEFRVQGTVARQRGGRLPRLDRAQ